MRLIRRGKIKQACNRYRYTPAFRGCRAGKRDARRL
jgi:hypothetical protein